MQIRDATREDLKIIVDIYNASIPSRIATADTEPITVESRIQWFEHHSPTSRPILVMEDYHQVIGWLSFQSFYGRPAYQQTAEISLYVSPYFQNKGIGKMLLQYAIFQSPNLGLKTLLAFVFAHNQASLNLFAKFQFQEWGYFPRVALLDDIERDLMILGRRIVF